MRPGEQEELRARVLEAWEVREQHPEYVTDAAAAIVSWYLRLPLTRLERKQERDVQLIELLRQTDPAQLGRGRRAAA